MKLKTLIILAFSMSVSAFAQTEIEGEVSGEWTSDGSPYIVVDSTWIPEGDSLTVLEAVTIIFEEDQGLYAYGTLTCLGSEEPENHIQIGVAEDVEHWRGLRFYGQNHVIFEYTDIVCPDTAIALDNAYRVTMTNCRVRSNYSSINSLPNVHAELWTIQIISSVIMDKSNLGLMWCQFYAEDSEFHHYTADTSEVNTIVSLGGVFTLSNCQVNARLTSRSRINIQDSRFGGVNSDPGGIYIGRDADGIISNTIIEGGLTASARGEDNLILEDCFIGGEFNVRGFEVEVSGCVISDATTIALAFASFRNCRLSTNFTNEESLTTIDSCFMTIDNEADNKINVTRSGRLTVKRSVVETRKIHIRDLAAATFDHNTIIISGGIPGHGPVENGDPRSRFTNNIFISNDEFNYESLLFYGSELPDTFGYNCIQGFDAYALTGAEREIIEFPETNIIEDPQLQWFVNIPFLSQDSPCVNAGDPYEPYDADGTRSDIGAFTYYYANSVDDYSTNTIYPTITEISAYPNPFNNVATFAFTLNQPSTISIDIYNILGKLQKRLLSRSYAAGSHSVSWDGSGLPSGDYLVWMTANEKVSTRKITMIK